MSTAIAPSITQNTVDKDDCVILAQFMRKSDIEEAWAYSHSKPIEAIVNSVKGSRWAFTVRVDGESVCICGICDGSMEGIGVPWLLATDLFENYPRYIMKLGKDFIRQYLTAYVSLVNYVKADNEKTIRWLKWLGFTVDPPAPFGPDLVNFCYFHMRGHGICAHSSQ